MFALLQGILIRPFPGCQNAAGKLRQKGYATAGTKFTIPGNGLIEIPCKERQTRWQFPREISISHSGAGMPSEPNDENPAMPSMLHDKLFMKEGGRYRSRDTCPTRPIRRRRNVAVLDAYTILRKIFCVSHSTQPTVSLNNFLASHQIWDKIWVQGFDIWCFPIPKM